MGEVQVDPENITGRGAGSEQDYRPPGPDSAETKRRALGSSDDSPHTVPDVAGARHWLTAAIERSAASGER